MSNTTTCGRCNEGDLVWEEINGKWRLVNRFTNVPHTCTDAPDDFWAKRDYGDNPAVQEKRRWWNK